MWNSIWVISFQWGRDFLEEFEDMGIGFFIFGAFYEVTDVSGRGVYEIFGSF